MQSETYPTNTHIDSARTRTSEDEESSSGSDVASSMKISKDLWEDLEALVELKISWLNDLPVWVSEA